METRAQYITTIRGLARSRGHRIGTSAPEYFLVALKKANLPADAVDVVTPLSSALERIGAELARTDALLEELAGKERMIERHTTAPGVGLVVAAAFVAVIDEARRFDGAHQVESYLGLVPSEATTGGKRKLGSITKQGNGYMRQLLVQSASSILRVGDASDPLRRWGRALVERRSRKIAVVALARRLAGVLWAMWKRGTVYEPARMGVQEPPAEDASAASVALKNAARKFRIRVLQTKRALRTATAVAAKEAHA